MGAAIDHVQPLARLRMGARRGWLSPLGALGVAALIVLVAAGLLLAAGASTQRLLFFVPGAMAGFPGWMQGPLDGLRLGLTSTGGALLLVAMSACYVVVLAAAPRIPARAVVAAIVVLNVLFLLAPPLFSADVFGYIDYARLGALHGLGPYTHGAADAARDSVAPFVRWSDVPSPYGPLFTAASYVLAPLSVAVTLWTYKALAALAALGCAALIWRLAPRVGLDPRRAAAFFALNPLVLAYGVGGAHNDLLLELLVLGGVLAAVCGRARLAGGQLALAALVKASAGLALPFLVARSRLRGRVLAGALAATIAVALLGLAVLGHDLLGFVAQIRDQQRLVAAYSVPNQLGVALGFGAITAGIRAVALVLFAANLAWQLWRAVRGADWVACAGWATLGALVTSAWLTPWYVVWVLALAAVAPSPRLRAATLGFCGYVMLTRIAYVLLG
jgi:alpha-1,6-mannosyltransferase